jgi:hypothetical protein
MLKIGYLKMQVKFDMDFTTWSILEIYAPWFAEKWQFP